MKKQRDDKSFTENPTSSYHVPVLLLETIEGLNIRPDGIYVDCTFGGGGHAKEILKQLDQKGKLIASTRTLMQRRIFRQMTGLYLFRTTSGICNAFSSSTAFER